MKLKMEKVHIEELKPISIKRELSIDPEDSGHESKRSLRQSIQNRLKRIRSNEEDFGTNGGKKLITEVTSLNSENPLSTMNPDILLKKDKRKAYLKMLTKSSILVLNLKMKMK
jgi:hypothetical protein